MFYIVNTIRTHKELWTISPFFEIICLFYRIKGILLKISGRFKGILLIIFNRIKGILSAPKIVSNPNYSNKNKLTKERWTRDLILAIWVFSSIPLLYTANCIEISYYLSNIEAYCYSSDIIVDKSISNIKENLFISSLDTYIFNSDFLIKNINAFFLEGMRKASDIYPNCLSYLSNNDIFNYIINIKNIELIDIKAFICNYTNLELLLDKFICLLEIDPNLIDPQILNGSGSGSSNSNNPSSSPSSNSSNPGSSNVGPSNPGPSNPGPSNSGPSNSGPSDSGPSNSGDSYTSNSNNTSSNNNNNVTNNDLQNSSNNKRKIPYTPEEFKISKRPTNEYFWNCSVAARNAEYERLGHVMLGYTKDWENQAGLIKAHYNEGTLRVSYLREHSANFETYLAERKNCFFGERINKLNEDLAAIQAKIEYTSDIRKALSSGRKHDWYNMYTITEIYSGARDLCTKEFNNFYVEHGWRLKYSVVVHEINLNNRKT